MKRALRLRDGCPRPGRAALRGRGGVCGGTTAFLGEVGRQQAARPPRLPRRKRPTRGAPRVESPTAAPRRWPRAGGRARVTRGLWEGRVLVVPVRPQINSNKGKKQQKRRQLGLGEAQRRPLRKRGALLRIFSLKAPHRVRETDQIPPARKTSAGSPQLEGASSLFPSWHRGDGAGEAARGLRGVCAAEPSQEGRGNGAEPKALQRKRGCPPGPSVPGCSPAPSCLSLPVPARPLQPLNLLMALIHLYGGLHPLASPKREGTILSKQEESCPHLKRVRKWDPRG